MLNRAFLKLYYMREHPVLNLGPLKYSLIGKIQDEGQSAGNSNRSSSETTRKAFILKDDLFKLWFVGFVEGGGSFIINEDGYLEFRITQSSNDAQVLFRIKKMLGFGVVRLQDSKRKTHCYRVRDKENLSKLISIFNGSIFLESRKIQFKLWLEAFNIKYKENVLYLNEDFKPSLNDSWLSGFTDAEGCFTCSISDNKTQTASLIRLRYILYQKGNSVNMDHLANILGGKKHYIKSYDGYNVVVNTMKLSSIVQYFSIFSLKTKKYITYFNWIKIYKLMIINKNHNSIEGLTLIRKYKDNMNRLNNNEQVLESNVFKAIIDKKCFSVILLLFILYLIYILINDILYDIFSPVLCMAGEDLNEKKQAINEASNGLNASNNNLSVNKPEIHLHNPNITIPGEIGTSVGLGGAVSAGIYALSKSKVVASMPPGTKAAYTAAGGIIGGTAFVAANYLNTVVQKNAKNYSSRKSDSYPAKSIIEEGDNIDNIMYFLNWNIIICIIVLLLLLLLIYLYVYKRNNIWVILAIWTFTVIVSIISVYLAYCLLEDIDIIARICHDIDSSKKTLTNYNWEDDTIQFLTSVLILRCCIPVLLYLLLISHAYSMIAKNNHKFILLKHLWGERIHSYFIKSVNLASKTNWIWMTIGATLLVFSCLMSIYIAFSTYNYIYDITELYLNSKK
uniref:Homing endonuclease LAGLIDADG domain-containing protein n=1 Tax=Epichloe typhina TaxID=5113 RepID=A0A1J0D001_EPITY|nr:hypothetical protein [Epichloe typhina]APB96753.1 hypothetical protein [Epichloe typhina]